MLHVFRVLMITASLVFAYSCAKKSSGGSDPAAATDSGSSSGGVDTTNGTGGGTSTVGNGQPKVFMTGAGGTKLLLAKGCENCDAGSTSSGTSGNGVYI